MLTLEMGVDCSTEGNCKGGRHICEVTVLEEAWAKKQSLDEEKTRCAEREPNTRLEFIGNNNVVDLFTTLP